MSDDKPIDEPSPTIVGPQPPAGGKKRRMNVPRGLERLVAVASLNKEWRAQVLADPLAAAEEAGLKLSDSERAVVCSVPRKALEAMIDSFGKVVGPKQPSLTKSAALSAAIAILAANLCGCDAILGQFTMGIMPDDPQYKPKKDDAPAQEETAEPGKDARLDRKTRGIRSDEPRRKPAPKVEEETADEHLRIEIGGAMPDVPARMRTQGITPDVPPSKGKPRPPGGDR